MKLLKHCSECNKLWETSTRDEFMDSFIVHNKHCEHIIVETSLSSDVPDFTFHDGTKPYEFQKENISLFLKSNIKAGCFDEVGLGKTLSALGLLRLYDINPKAFGDKGIYPCAILVKSGLRLQWSKEVINRLGHLAQIIDAQSEPNFDLFKIHIYSMDYLKNKKTGELPYKTVIIDECQLIKNPEAKRTNAVRDLVRGNEDTAEKNVIVLSGTPIKNNAGEYFVVCNLTHPELFPNYEGFLRTWTSSYFSGRGKSIGGLKNPKAFKEYTKDFFIRHEQKEVLPDLPKVIRNFQIRVLEDTFQKRYDSELEGFSDYYNESEGDDSFERSSNILAYMQRMRHIVGIAKSKDAVEFATEFLESTDRKLVIFHHHHDVGELISKGMQEVCKSLELSDPLLISDVSNDLRESRIQKFLNREDGRLLIASTLKSGEGLNLQVCSDCLIVERQWNPANEEQAEGRFRRIGSLATHINSNYLLAAGSIDELFSEIVERKRKLIEEANKGEILDSTWDEKGVMSELAEVLARSGRKKYNVGARFEAQKEIRV